MVTQGGDGVPGSLANAESPQCSSADAADEFANLLANAGEVSELLLEGGEGQVTRGAGQLKDATRTSRVGGFVCAVTAGLFGGLVLAPMFYSRLAGLRFVPSMSVGAGLASPLTLVAGRLMREAAAPPGGKAAATTPALARCWWAAVGIAVASGMLWNFGNTCSIVATKEVRAFAHVALLPWQQLHLSHAHGCV
jgi:hypothetical protein